MVVEGGREQYSNAIGLTAYHSIFIYMQCSDEEEFELCHHSMCYITRVPHVSVYVNKMKNRLLPPSLSTSTSSPLPVLKHTGKIFTKKKYRAQCQNALWQWWFKKLFSKWIGSTQVSGVRLCVYLAATANITIYNRWQKWNVYLHNDRKDIQREFKPPAEWWGRRDFDLIKSSHGVCVCVCVRGFWFSIFPFTLCAVVRLLYYWSLTL